MLREDDFLKMNRLPFPGARHPKAMGPDKATDSGAHLRSDAISTRKEGRLKREEADSESRLRSTGFVFACR
jgi:hypothetical protein